MRIWFDADNGPHVLIMEPLARRLREDGHEVRFTARDRSNTCQLLDMFGFEYDSIGHEYGRGKLQKAAGTIARAFRLAGRIRSWHPAVSFGHGSRALPVAAKLLGVPSVTMYDYEWVDPRLFSWGCQRILLPEVVDDERCREAGIDTDKVSHFPGLKEHVYLAGRSLDDSVADDLGLRPDSLRILMRPPATIAHYHNPEAEELLSAVLDLLRQRDDVQLVYLARDDDQLAWIEGLDPGRVVVPQRVYDGPSLVAAMDMVFSGGGTMTREAAVLGVPSYSFFRGRPGRVDEHLESEGRLVMLRTAGDVRSKIVWEKKRGGVTIPDNHEVRDHVAAEILAAARR